MPVAVVASQYAFIESTDHGPVVHLKPGQSANVRKLLNTELERTSKQIERGKSSGPWQPPEARPHIDDLVPMMLFELSLHHMLNLWDYQSSLTKTYGQLSTWFLEACDRFLRLLDLIHHS